MRCPSRMLACSCPLRHITLPSSSGSGQASPARSWLCPSSTFVCGGVQQDRVAAVRQTAAQTEPRPDRRSRLSRERFWTPKRPDARQVSAVAPIRSTSLEEQRRFTLIE